MFKIVVIIALSVTACYGAAGTYCGKTPRKIYECIQYNPMVISQDVASKCSDPIYTECERITCLFREYKWLDGTAVNKAKVTSHFDQYAKEKPEWSPAIQHLKAVCLGQELQPQGEYLNCPAYDVMHCASTSFIRHASPAQWSTSAVCAYPREFAAACPVCPEGCYEPQIPIGSCNACLSLPPRTP